jgi:hypothetical protein
MFVRFWDMDKNQPVPACQSARRRERLKPACPPEVRKPVKPIINHAVLPNHNTN